MYKKGIQFACLLSVIVLIHAFRFHDILNNSPVISSQRSLEQRVDSLLQLLTLEEKIGQMTLFTSDWDITGPTIRATYKDDIQKGKVGAIFNAHTVAYNRELQRMAVEETRLGIPLLFGYDVIHGYKTIFPIPLGEAASWNLELIEASARTSAVEASAAGLHWTFAPMVDISRDPRWGRIAESAGEDTFLGSQIAKARVKGFQGNDLSKDNTILACAKHYAAYGAAQAGRDYHTVDISEHTLREIYLPPFKAAHEAGVRTFMTSFNELFGVPATANSFLLNDILRQEWGFQGFVVTDYTSINEMVPHGFAANEREAGEHALKAGVDMDMQGAVYYNYLAQSVREGKVSIKSIDEAVRRILRLKFELGLFDDPYRYSDPVREKERIFSSEHRELARKIACESIVLLKNEKQTLPLSKNIRSLAVIGPLADAPREMLGSWSAAGEGNQCISLLSGIRSKLSNQTQIRFSTGCTIDGADKTGFADAIAQAKKSEAVVLALGEAALMSGEAASRSKIDLPGVQEELLRTILATGKPVIVVLMNGRPLTIPWADDQVSAILETWFLGTEGGNAIADVLFGDYNPSGKLPVTFPRSIGQIPVFYNAKNTGRPMDANNKYTSKYLDVANTPQYPFGFGLSYTTFQYSDLKTDRDVFTSDQPLTLSVQVTNTGSRAGAEVVQFYIRDMFGATTRPVKELKGFQKIFLNSGENRIVRFTLKEEDVRFYNSKMEWISEAGNFRLFVGGNSEKTLETSVLLRK